MPIYEYQCSACGHTLDAFQKMSDAALTLCPNCDKETLTKLISAAGFQLKGTGWYATDFKNKGKPTETAATKATETKTDSSPTTTPDKGTSNDKSNSGNSSAN